jgi:hypothetical protein
VVTATKADVEVMVATFGAICQAIELIVITRTSGVTDDVGFAVLSNVGSSSLVRRKCPM